MQFIAELRVAVAEAWQGIVQAFLPIPDADAAEKKAMHQQAEEHVFKYLPHILPFVANWMQAFYSEHVAPDAEIEDDETLARLKVVVGLLGDIGCLWGKANMQSQGFRANEPALRVVLDLADKLEKESWGSDTRDADGARRTTLAAWARENMNR